MGADISTIERNADTATTASTWQIDAAHSTIDFSVKHMMFTNAKGRFNEFAGTIVYDEANPANSSVQVEIVTDSIDTRDAKRDAHIRSSDFFDVETYPKATFVSTRVEPRGDDKFRITGELTLRGVTREVVLDAELTGQGKNPWGQEVIGFSATTKINRRDFGVNWSAALETGGVLVGDEVKLTFEIEATKQA